MKRATTRPSLKSRSKSTGAVRAMVIFPPPDILIRIRWFVDWRVEVTRRGRLAGPPPGRQGKRQTGGPVSRTAGRRPVRAERASAWLPLSAVPRPSSPAPPPPPPAAGTPRSRPRSPRPRAPRLGSSTCRRKARRYTQAPRQRAAEEAAGEQREEHAAGEPSMRLPHRAVRGR